MLCSRMGLSVLININRTCACARLHLLVNTGQGLSRRQLRPHANRQTYCRSYNCPQCAVMFSYVFVFLLEGLHAFVALFLQSLFSLYSICRRFFPFSLFCFIIFCILFVDFLLFFSSFFTCVFSFHLLVLQQLLSFISCHTFVQFILFYQQYFLLRVGFLDNNFQY